MLDESHCRQKYQKRKHPERDILDRYNHIIKDINGKNVVDKFNFGGFKGLDI